MPKVKMTANRHVPNDAGRRPIRPIDREKMRSWLERHLDMENVPDVRWVDRNRTMFEIPWRHAARHGWSIERDACIFEMWAKHTRKFIPEKDKVKDPKRWKANFRCALNSLPDVERVPGHLAKGSQAVRRYRFLTPDEGRRRSVKAARSRKRRRRNDSDSTEEEEEEEEEEATIEVKSESEDDTEPENNLPCGLSTASIPNFDQLLTDSDATPRRETRSTSHMSGGSLFQLRDIAPPPSPQARSVSPHSLEGSSDSEGSHYSDEEVVEMVNSWQLENCPKLWSDMTDLTDSVGCEVECVTEEVRCVIRFDPPEYWDLSSPME
ncbi:interferon regulatory factor 1-like isoform X6 [Haliotis rufescens]|uniref:interferon regulatory factor 1-like isoform X6 n=1 Tax=Haliotis rufescens TaxID=6454 RepID=UPI001EB094BB|nr:interferon regulatory factor 1-like isoform X6 [Haliotis rufescens]